MAADDDRALFGFQDSRALFHDLHRLGLRFGGADRKHGEVAFVGQPDEDTFIGRVHLDVWSGLALAVLAHKCGNLTLQSACDGLALRELSSRFGWFRKRGLIRLRVRARLRWRRLLLCR